MGWRDPARFLSPLKRSPAWTHWAFDRYVSLQPGGGLNTALARRAYDVAGWHTELYIEGTQLPGLWPQLSQLPLPGVDRLGLTEEGLPDVLNVVEHGVRVRANGFGRVRLDIARALNHFDAANPKALLFGTDLPGTRAPRAFCASDLDQINGALGEDALARLSANGRAWYRLEQPKPS